MKWNLIGKKREKKLIVGKESNWVPCCRNWIARLNANENGKKGLQLPHSHQRVPNSGFYLTRKLQWPSEVLRIWIGITMAANWFNRKTNATWSDVKRTGNARDTYLVRNVGVCVQRLGVSVVGWISHFEHPVPRSIFFVLTRQTNSHLIAIRNSAACAAATTTNLFFSLFSALKCGWFDFIWTMVNFVRIKQISKLRWIWCAAMTKRNYNKILWINLGWAMDQYVIVIQSKFSGIVCRWIRHICRLELIHFNKCVCAVQTVPITKE